MGDDIQAIKAGILEIADIFVVSKADKPGADQTVAELRMMLTLGGNRRKVAWAIPVLKTSVPNNEGIEKVVEAMQQHRDYLVTSGLLMQRAQRQVRSELQALILHTVMNTLKTQVSEEEWAILIEDVATRERDPYSVADELETKIGLFRHV